MTKYDIENSAAATEVKQAAFRPTAASQSTWFNSSNWTHHAKQWLKGGAVILGTVVMGGMTYVFNRSSRGKSSEQPLHDPANGGVVLNEQSSVVECQGGKSLSENILLNFKLPIEQPRTLPAPIPVTNSGDSKPTIKSADNKALDLMYPGTEQKDEKELQRKDAAVTEFLVSTYTYGAGYPAAVPLSNGGFIIAWDGSGADDSSWDGIYGQRFSNSAGKQGSEFLINSYTPNYQEVPAVACLNDGQFVVVWCGEGSGDSVGIYGRRYSSDWVVQGSQFQINSFISYNQISPSITALTGGGFVVVWESYRDGDSSIGVYGQRFDNNTVKQGGEFQIHEYTVAEQRYPGVSGLSSGGFAVVWGSHRGADDSVYGRLYNANGVAQGGEFQISTSTAYYNVNPSVVSLNTGGFIVVWLSTRSNSGYILGKSYDNNGIVQLSEFDISSRVITSDSYPAVTVLPNGDFVVVWQNYIENDTLKNLYGRRFNANAIAQCSEFQINTATGINQSMPTVSYLSSGGFVAAWASEDQGGARLGIYGRTFRGYPTLTNKSLTIYEGQKLQMTSGMFKAQDLDAPDSQLTFSVLGIQHGNFECSNTTVVSFTQQQVLGGYIYLTHSGDEFPPVFSVSVSNGPYSTSPESATITFNNVNDAPLLNCPANLTLTSIMEDTLQHQGDAISSIVNGCSITDPDSVTGAIAIIEVDETNGVLQYTLDNTVWENISPVSGSESLLLESINKVRFIPRQDFNGNASFTFRAWDKAIGIVGNKVDTTVNGGATAFSVDTSSASVTVLPVNDAPVLTASANPVLTSINEDVTVPAGDLVSSIVVTGSITDRDSSTGAIAITEADNVHGTWQYSLDNITWLPIAPVSILSSLLLDSANKIRFVPNPDFDGNATFTFRAWDKTSGSIGVKVNTTVNGGNTAFSTATNTATITVININDAPVLSSSVHPQLTSIAEDTTAPNGDTASSIISGLVTDPDNPLGPMVVTEVDNTYGNWQYKLDSTLWKPIAPVTDVSGLLLDAHHKIRFVPNAEFSGDSSFTFRAWDKTTGVAGTKVDTTVNGGTTAFSSESNFAMVTVTSVNDLPILENNQLAINQGQSVVLTNARLKATDVDNDVTNLQFVISELTHGKFAVVNNTEIGLTTFLQQQITDEEILFIHDNSDKTPSYKVAVSDGVGTTQPEAAAIDFKTASTNTKTIVDNSKTASRSDQIKDAIIYSSVSGGIGIMLLFLKIYLGHKATQRLKKSTDDYQTSVERDQEEFEKNTLMPIAKEIFNRVKITGFFGYIGEQTAKDYVAAVGKLVEALEGQGVMVDLNAMSSVRRNRFLAEVGKQTRKTLIIDDSLCSSATFTRLYKPDVKPEDIEDYAEEIAIAVKKSLSSLQGAQKIRPQSDVMHKDIELEVKEDVSSLPANNMV